MTIEKSDLENIYNQQKNWQHIIERENSRFKHDIFNILVTCKDNILTFKEIEKEENHANIPKTQILRLGKNRSEIAITHLSGNDALYIAYTGYEHKSESTKSFNFLYKDNHLILPQFYHLKKNIAIHKMFVFDDKDQDDKVNQYLIDCSCLIESINLNNAIYIKKDLMITNSLTKEYWNMNEEKDIIGFCKFLIQQNNISAHDTMDFFEQWIKTGSKYQSFIDEVKTTFQNIKTITNKNTSIYNSFKKEFENA